MKIELIRGTVIDGQGKDPGDVVDVCDTVASMLMDTGKGVPASDKPKQSNRSIGLKTSNTPKTKTRKAK